MPKCIHYENIHQVTELLALVFTQVSFASFKWEMVLFQHYLETGQSLHSTEAFQDKEADTFLFVPMGDSSQ